MFLFKLLVSQVLSGSHILMLCAIMRMTSITVSSFIPLALLLQPDFLRVFLSDGICLLCYASPVWGNSFGGGYKLRSGSALAYSSSSVSHVSPQRHLLPLTHSGLCKKKHPASPPRRAQGSLFSLIKNQITSRRVPVGAGCEVSADFISFVVYLRIYISS